MVVAMEYDDRHRIFLQGIMNLGIVSGSTARKLLQKACNISGHTVPTDTGEINKTLRALTDGINREIRPLNLSIVKAIDENKIKKETYFVLINQLDRSQEFTELTKRFSNLSILHIYLYVTIHYSSFYQVHGRICST
uniref:Non-structural maintenance of chromosomes element 1 homolog n=1 Tax=Lepeophtheirus salmonis TaxID=72036 RepID=A0A0K2TMS8_LEPSM